MRNIVPLADGWRYAGNFGRTRPIGTSEAFFKFGKQDRYALADRWNTTDSFGVPQLMGRRPMLRKRLLAQVRRNIVPLADGWRYAGNVGRTRPIGTSVAIFAFGK